MIDVAVLGGGISGEHEISVRSATEVFRALDRDRWRVRAVFLAKSGAWHVGATPGDSRVDAPFAATLGPPLRPGVAVSQLLDAGVQLVFPALHGRGGEDGTLQGMLELHGLPFVGSGTAASAVAMDKIRTRECVTSHGVPMAAAIVGSARGGRSGAVAEAARIARDVGFPCFVKLDLSGSSVGVTRCGDAAEAEAFLENHVSRRFVAEATLVGQEISVPVLGNSGHELRPLPPIGIEPLVDAFFDLRAKYEPGRTREVVPPPGMDEAMIHTVQRLALTCHTALGCDGVSRTDMIVTVDGPRVLEVNTLPGMTRESLLPKCAAAAGIDFPALLDLLLDFARQRASEECA